MPDAPINPSAQFLERKLSTILSADVAEFSRLMSEDEEQTLRTFRGHKQVFESLVALHRGRIFNTAGDAILAEFGSAVEAVRCATDIQAALRTRNDQLQPSRQVRFRIGVNLGDVMVQGQDLLGDGVNVAARLQTAAEPGGICISGSVHDQIRNKLSLSFQSLGERSYKNIQQPVRTFSITEAEGGGTLPSPKPHASGSFLQWIAAAVLLLLLGGGYWAYTAYERSNTAQASAAKPDAANSAGAQPPQVSNASQPATEKASLAAPAASVQPGGEPPPKKPVATRQATGSAQAPSAAPTATSTASEGPFDGVYSGPLCYGKTPNDPARCFRAKATVSGNRITGQWKAGRDSDVTMFLAGDVTPSGGIKMEMHSEKPDGSRVITIDLTGTVGNRQLDASGKFRNGRSASLNWHKIPAAH
ncbi:MAG TPA: adenylate/guanylate cyclase domain-containing protein [Candidatus Dormibacteraeota bacterium]|nr:adenylate/guanylate cyclase domain-containing protein [Candidatus Dormibacteraeota bacterium]